MRVFVCSQAGVLRAIFSRSLGGGHWRANTPKHGVQTPLQRLPTCALGSECGPRLCFLFLWTCTIFTYYYFNVSSVPMFNDGMLHIKIGTSALSFQKTGPLATLTTQAHAKWHCPLRWHVFSQLSQAPSFLIVLGRPIPLIYDTSCLLEHQSLWASAVGGLSRAASGIGFQHSLWLVSKALL